MLSMRILPYKSSRLNMALMRWLVMLYRPDIFVAKSPSAQYFFFFLIWEAATFKYDV